MRHTLRIRLRRPSIESTPRQTGFSAWHHATFGADSNIYELTYMTSLSDGVFGWELQVSFTPDFFEGKD